LDSGISRTLAAVGYLRQLFLVRVQLWSRLAPVLFRAWPVQPVAVEASDAKDQQQCRMQFLAAVSIHLFRCRFDFPDRD
jgi:hypothetical protein